MSSEETYDTIIIGGGQAGLAASFYLTQRGENYIILDENNRIGRLKYPA
jgi:putative flavoprotein involved in K+ transport